MLLADYLTEIRARTDHDADTQVEDASLSAFLNRRAALLFRRLARAFPELYKATTVATALSPSVSTIAKPADFGGMIRVEVQQPGTSGWSPVMKSSVAPESDCFIGWSETGTHIAFAPVAALTGNFRLVYRRAPALAYTIAEADILPGFEDVLIEEGIGFTRERAEEKENAAEKAEKAYREARRAYVARAGDSPEPGFIQLRD